MDFDRKYKENLGCSQPMFFPENYLKPPPLPYMGIAGGGGGDGGFSFQDFHHHHNNNHHQFPGNASSKTLQFGACLEPLDSFGSYGSAMNLDVYELKPFADNIGVVENLQTNNGGGGGYLLHPHNNHHHHHHHQRASEMVGVERGGRVAAFNCEEIKPVNFVIPDEVSCITAENGLYKKISMSSSSAKMNNRVSPAAKKTHKGRKKPHVVKGQWTIEEDRLLIQLVEQYGVRKWSLIAQMLNGRIGKQCRERWHNHLRPNIKKDIWSEEEDKILIGAHAEIGNKWAEIAKRLPGRTENSIKNHWNATKRRQLSRRKCRSKYPRQSTLLQNYIKSLNLDYHHKSNPNPTTTTIASPPLPPPPPPSLLRTSTASSDRLAPDYDYEEVPDFSFDANIFQENCSIDSLLNDMSTTAPPPPPPTDDDDDKDIEMGMVSSLPLMDMASFMHTEVKKEMDLVDIISQVNL